MRTVVFAAKPRRGMLGSRRVENLRLHFGNRQQADRPLATGVHRVVRESNGMLGVGDAAQGALLAQFCVDRRGLWLQVASSVRGVHVNGRPVQRMAQLRPGDCVYVDGVEILVRASHRNIDASPAPAQHDAGDPRIVIRGVGGRHHGRSYPLTQVCVVGRAQDADIRLDAPAFAERHAQLERRGERVQLRALGSAPDIVVNGMPTREALLVAGDQVVFDSQHRFLVEVPWLGSTASAGESGSPDGDSPTPPERPAPGLQVKRWPWLLLAALLLAALLSALLLFGPG